LVAPWVVIASRSATRRGVSTADPPVAIEERMNRLELVVPESGPDEQRQFGRLVVLE